MQLLKKTLAVVTESLKFSRSLFQLNAIDELNTLAKISKRNAKAINELVQANRTDKICSLITSLNQENLRLQNRSRRRGISIHESIDAAFDLNRRLSEICIKGQDGKYID